MCLAFANWDLDYQLNVVGECYYAQMLDKSYKCLFRISETRVLHTCLL